MNSFPTTNSSTDELNSFAKRYRVDASKATLREFRDMSGRPFLGSLYWLALRTRVLKLNSQILDGPRPFAEDLCELDAFREPIRSHVLAMCDSAERLGFHTRMYSVSNSTGAEVHGGAVRLLDPTGRSFLQIIAAASGDAMQSHEMIVSATSSKPMNVVVTTNGPPSYKSPPCVTAQRHRGVPLQELIEIHHKSIKDKNDLISFSNLADIARVIDHVSVMFFAEKVARGIFVEVPEP